MQKTIEQGYSDDRNARNMRLPTFAFRYSTFVSNENFSLHTSAFSLVESPSKSVLSRHNCINTVRRYAKFS